MESFGQPFLRPGGTGIPHDSSRQSKKIVKSINRNKNNLKIDLEFGEPSLVGFYCEQLIVVWKMSMKLAMILMKVTKRNI